MGTLTERPALAEKVTDRLLEEKFQNKLVPNNHVGISQYRLVFAVQTGKKDYRKTHSLAAALC